MHGKVVLTLELSSSIHDDQHAIARVCVHRSRGQVTWHAPGVALLSRWHALDNRIAGSHTVGGRALAKNQTDGHAVCRVRFWVPCHCV